MASRFWHEQRRRTYVTPRSFLELLSLYTSMLGSKRAEVSAAVERLDSGVRKLREANESVSSKGPHTWATATPCTSHAVHC